MAADIIDSYLEDLSAATAALCLKTLLKIVSEVRLALSESRSIAICGNGGSSSTAGHLVCDLHRVAGQMGVKVRITDLTANTSTLTALANDFGYERALEIQVERTLEAEDVLICFSVSGSSPNVIHAIEKARERGVKVIAVTGKSGGDCFQRKLADIHLRVQSLSIYIVEDIHLSVVHMVTAALEAPLLQTVRQVA